MLLATTDLFDPKYQSEHVLLRAMDLPMSCPDQKQMSYHRYARGLFDLPIILSETWQRHSVQGFLQAPFHRPIALSTAPRQPAAPASGCAGSQGPAAESCQGFRLREMTGMNQAKREAMATVPEAR